MHAAATGMYNNEVRKAWCLSSVVNIPTACIYIPTKLLSILVLYLTGLKNPSVVVIRAVH